MLSSLEIIFIHLTLTCLDLKDDFVLKSIVFLHIQNMHAELCKE